MTKRKTKTQDNGVGEEIIQLVFTPPDPEEPGFFRRAIEVQELFDNAQSVDDLRKLMSYLSQYFDGPQDEITELLMDASKMQIREMVTAIVGGGGNDPFGLATVGK